MFLRQVDDPDNLGAEEEYKLKAVREKVQDQWKVDCRKRALEQLLAPECSKYEPVFPVFVPTSAKTAYLLRAGSAVSKKEFSQKMPVEYFHSIGQQEFGKKWRDMSEDAKHEAIHDLLMCPQYRKELLRMSGFDKFLGALEICIGGDQAQLAMIRKNFMRDLELCDFGACDMMSKLRSMNEKRQILGEQNSSLKAKVDRNNCYLFRLDLSAFHAGISPFHPPLSASFGDLILLGQIPPSASSTLATDLMYLQCQLRSW